MATSSMFLAVDPATGRVHLEDNHAAIHNNLERRQGNPNAPGTVKFYSIELDVDNVPSIGGEVTLKPGPRNQRAVIESQDLVVGGQVVGSVDIEV